MATGFLSRFVSGIAGGMNLREGTFILGNAMEEAAAGQGAANHWVQQNVGYDSVRRSKFHTLEL
jgi:hypothetical protein